MLYVPDLNPDAMNAEMDYRRERLTHTRFATRPVPRRGRLRRHRERPAA